VLIQTEVEFVELYKGQPMFADVDIFLRASGFQFHTLNSFFGRVLGHDVVRSYDLAHLALSALDNKTGRGFSAGYLQRLSGQCCNA